MNPTITNIFDEENVLKFTIKDINVSLANALRRVILADIPQIVFRTFPHEKNDAVFDINTSRLNNEIVKQRLSCIPVHISDKDFPLADHIMELDVNNDTKDIIYVTTKDFKIKNVLTEKYLSDALVTQIFPPNNITSRFIDFVRLRPRLSDSIPGEHLKMSCKFSIGNAKENGMFNVVSTCAYGGSLDATKISQVWIEKEKELKDAHTKEEIAFKKKDWLLLDAKRLVLENSFDYTIETLGVYSNLKICEMACQIIVKKLQNLINIIQTNKDIIKPSDNTMPNSYDVTLDGEDYTIGKILEFVLYDKYFGNEITFCGFRKPHPHIDTSVLRVAFKTDIDNTEIITYLVTACSMNIEIYDKLSKNFARD